MALIKCPECGNFISDKAAKDRVRKVYSNRKAVYANAKADHTFAQKAY